MTQDTACMDWLAALSAAVDGGAFIKLTLNAPTTKAGDLKSVDVRPILIKRLLKLSFTYHHQTRDVVKNYTLAESIELLTALLQDFAAARLYTLAADYHLAHKGNNWHITTHAPTQKNAPVLAHDRAKTRLIESANKPYLHALGIADAQGKVIKSAQDKFRQINKYIEILDGLIKQLPAHETLRLVDMGAGKGYLTFALYDHLTTTLGMNVEITGVEYRADLVQQCNAIAEKSQFSGLRFVQGSIADYDCTGAHGIIALHACDTATDDAIHKALRANAALIVVAPCCHKQIRRAMGPVDETNPLDFLMQYGTYTERIAEMVTDGMRAQLMELQGYRTNIFEFISDMHTPKNVMIVAIKSSAPPSAKRQAKLQASIAASKATFHIGQHYLEKLIDSDERA